MENLFIQTAFVGDLFLSIPALRRIKKIDPDIPLVLYCRKGLGETFLNLKLVDEVVEVDKQDKTSFIKAQNYLKSKNYKRIIVPHRSPRNTWLVGRLKAKEKVGYANFWNFLFFNTRVRRPMHLPEALRQMALFEHMDSEIKEGMKEVYKEKSFDSPIEKDTVNFSLKTKIPSWASLSVRNALEGVQTNTELSETVFIAPGSVWNTKKWTETGFTAVAKALLDEGHKVALIGAPNEREICLRIAEHVPKAQVLAGELSLYETFLALSEGKALICNDSGAMHMASAVELPVVSVFGPTTLDIGYRPWSDQSVVVQKTMDCRPCGLHGGEKCPIQTHDCMKTITAIDVLRSFRELLE